MVSAPCSIVISSVSASAEVVSSTRMSGAAALARMMMRFWILIPRCPEYGAL